MKTITLVISLLLYQFSFAQESKSIKITGSIIEKNSSQPLIFANITLLNATDQSIVSGTVTDDNGVFFLEVQPGTYSLTAEFIGFLKKEIDSFSVTENLSIPPITLEQDPEMLDVVNITGEKSTIEYKLDKRVFNVGKDIVSKGGTATDVLSNVPSVNVDAGGGISLRGNGGVRILINGKPSILTANGGLETIAAENIEKIEVVTNPSAKYDAEGTAGIINIILKKNRNGGFSSSLQLTTGIPDNHSINYNVSYKRDKFNFFSNFRYSSRKFEGERSYFRTNFEDGAISSFLDQDVTLNRGRTVANIYGGGDYYLDDLNTLTLSYYYRNNTSNNTTDYTYRFLNSDSSEDSVATSIEKYREPQIANQIELNYVKEFEEKGQKFTVNIQYDFWNDDENEEVYFNGLNISEGVIPSLKSRDVESSDDFLFQSDYSLPLGEKSKMEMGIKGEIRRIDSDYIVWNDGQIIDSLDNFLVYHERIYGAYTQYENSIHKLQYLLGLRMEISDTESSDPKDQFQTNKNYHNFFPTAHLTYKFNDELNLQLSYSKRIRRPRFWQLNPFGGISDNRNIRIGNPDLNPMFTDSYELGLLKRWEKLTVNPSLYFQQTTNLFETAVTLNSDNVLVTQNINSGAEDRYGFEIVSTYSPYKWWRISHELNIYGYDQTGIYTVSDNTFYTSLNSTFKFPSVSIQTSFDYEAANDRGQRQSEDVFYANAGISKDLWADKASLSLNVRNIFDSRVYKDRIVGNDYVVEQESFWSGRRLSATFTYRFNRSKNDRDRMPD